MGWHRGTGPAEVEGAGTPGSVVRGPCCGTLPLGGGLKAPPLTWTRPGVVEAAVPGEKTGLVAEARPVDPVQPPAAGEAGGVPARAAAPRLGAAGQRPGPQPRQRAQRQPHGPHGPRSGGARDAAARGIARPAAAAAAAPSEWPATAALPGPAPRGPSPRGGRCGLPGPRGGRALPAPRDPAPLPACGPGRSRCSAIPAAAATSPGPEPRFNVRRHVSERTLPLSSQGQSSPSGLGRALLASHPRGVLGEVPAAAPASITCLTSFAYAWSPAFLPKSIFCPFFVNQK